MKNWKERAEIDGDVIFFPAVSIEIEKTNKEVYIWDLDKTYLDTKIDSFFGLWRAVVERAFSKRNIPGTDTLLRALANEREKKTGSQIFPIYFITASPPQMEERISEKFLFDKIHPLGCFYKDNLRNLKPGRLIRLTKQVGYKLQALLQLRQRLHEDVQQVCFGDDSESDAVIYSLYSDICARRLSAGEIRQVLSKYLVTGDQVDRILELQSNTPAMDPVRRIYINLATDTDPEYYYRFGRRMLTTVNTYQTALDLYQQEHLSFEGIFRVAEDMIQNYDFTSDELTRSLDDMIRRGEITSDSWDKLRPQLIKHGLIYDAYEPLLAPRKKNVPLQEPWCPDYIDYMREER